MEKAEAIGIFTAFLIAFFLLGAQIGPYAPVAFSLAVGSSMFPTITNGDMLVCVSKYLVHIHPGDIAVYRKNGEYIVHRVITINREYAVFKGDNNMEPDGKIPLSNIYFKVVLILPAYVWVPIFATALSIYGVFLIWRKQRAKSKEKELYSLSSIIYFAAISTIIVMLSINTLATSPMYLVKPNPLPKITGFTINGNTMDVYFSNNIGEKLVCTGAIGRYTVTLPCVKLTGSHVKINITPLEKRCDKTICNIRVTIIYTVNTPYNVVVKYPFSTAITGGSAWS